MPLRPSTSDAAAVDAASPGPEAVLPHLQRLSLERSRGKRTLLVAPRDPAWYTSLAQAVRELTGLYPLLVQPAERRAEVGVPGPLRIIDMEAYLMDEDSPTSPPWMLDDGFLPG